MAGCGRCHTCGERLQEVLDGEAWCPKCGQYRRYRTHGWATEERTPCWPAPTLATRARGDRLNIYAEQVELNA